MNAMQITTSELRLLNLLSKNWNDVLSIERRSAREFDLVVQGWDAQTKNKFSGLMFLMGIKQLVNWTGPNIAAMSSYPEMVKIGDWSGIRDSDENAQWSIFLEHVVPLIEK